MLELSFQYRSFFSISVSHRYFKSAKSGSFYLKPNSNTQENLQKMGLMPKTHQGEIHTLYDVQHQERFQAFLQMESEVKFQFYLYSTELYFINITELPTESTQKIFYFSNRPKHLGLSKEERAGIQDLYPLRRSGQTWMNSEKKELKLEIQSDSGRTLYQKSLAAGSKLMYNFQGFQPGLYHLKAGSKVLESFVYLGDDIFPEPLALVEINLAGALRDEILDKLKQQEDIPHYKFGLAFEARNTYWRYYIVPKYENGLDSLSIDTGGEKINFKGPDSTQLPNGQSAYRFEAEKALPIQELSQYDFQLVNQKDNKGKKIRRVIQRLPVARPNAIHPESRSEDSKIYSEIYVYL